MERIIAKRTLRIFWAKHPDSEQHLKTWHETVMAAKWRNPAEIKKTFASASILKNGRVAFNIKGNSYRLVVKLNYQKQWCFIRFIGTHEEYDKIEANCI